MISNFQKIKQMNIDDLAALLAREKCTRCAYYGDICKGTALKGVSCKVGIKRFLSEEVGV